MLSIAGVGDDDSPPVSILALFSGGFEIRSVDVVRDDDLLTGDGVPNIRQPLHKSTRLLARPFVRTLIRPTKPKNEREFRSDPQVKSYKTFYQRQAY